MRSAGFGAPLYVNWHARETDRGARRRGRVRAAVLLFVALALGGARAARVRDDPPVSAADLLGARPPEEIVVPPEESVPERRDLPPLPLPPRVNSQKEYPVPAKRLFVEDRREPPPLPLMPRGEEMLVGGPGEDAAPFHRVRPDEAVFRLSHLAGEDNAGSEAEEDRVGGTIPPRLRAFNQAQKTWRGIKDLLRSTAKLEEKEEDEAIAESRKRLEAALKAGDEAAAQQEEKKLGSEEALETKNSGEGNEEDENTAKGEAGQGAKVPTRQEISAAAAQRIQEAVDMRILTDSAP